MSVELKSLLQSWNKKDIEFLKEIYQDYSNKSNFLKQLVSFLSSTKTESASSWLIKNYFYESREIKAYSKDIYHCLSKFENWEAQLHILQVMDRLNITSDSKKFVEQTLRKLLVSNNNFVKAWSYNGLYILATEFPEYRKEIDLFLKLGLEDEPASVKARIRNIIKSKDW